MNKHLVALTVSLLVGTALSPVADAQETTGVPGSPSATTTIDGRYLPPAPQPFGDEIGLDAKDSKPYWPAQVVPPKGAPKILLIITDDQRYRLPCPFLHLLP